MTAAVAMAVPSPADQGVVAHSAEEEAPTVKIRNVRMACLAGQCECPEHVEEHHQHGETTT